MEPEIDTQTGGFTLIKNKFLNLIFPLFLINSISAPASANNLGIFLGSFAEELSRSREEQLRKQQFELEQKRLELMERQHRLEQQRRLEAERQRFDEQQRQVEAERQAKAAAYKAGFTGSGFFVSKLGHILTNAHVIGEYKFIIARDSNGTFYDLDISHIDKANDLAILQAAKITTGLPIVIDDDLKGAKVYAIGYPQPSIQGGESKITDGIVSSMSGLRNDPRWYQITNPIQAGNSGGPLVNEAGSVVGVVVATINAAKFLSITGDVPQNVNFAIKPEFAISAMAQVGLKPLTTTVPKKNPLKYVDENTVLIFSRPEPFSISSIQKPNREPKKLFGNEQQTSRCVTHSECPVGYSCIHEKSICEKDAESNQNKIKGNSMNNSSEETPSPAQNTNKIIQCRIGTSQVVSSTHEKCTFVNGVILND